MQEPIVLLTGKATGVDRPFSKGAGCALAWEALIGFGMPADQSRCIMQGTPCLCDRPILTILRWSSQRIHIPSLMWLIALY